MMSYELDDIEIQALKRAVVDRARADLNGGKPLTEMAHKSGCNCPLHQLTREQLIARIDAAIDVVNAEVRANGGVLPAEPRPGERIQTWFCQDCQEEHTGSVLGGLIGDPHGEAKASCDACGELKPKAGFKTATVYGCEGDFCHDCRHGKGCDCGADDN